MLTSLYPKQHKVVNKYTLFTSEQSELAFLSPKVTSLAQVFKQNGYVTAAFTGGSGVAREFAFDRGFDVFFDSVPFGGFDLTMPKALNWIEEHQTQKFFLLVHGYDVHGQLELPDDFDIRFSTSPHRESGKATKERFMALRLKTIKGESVDVTETEKQFWIDLYDEKIARTDEKIGGFMDHLTRLPGLKEKTIVVMLSDHGEQLFERGGVDHGTSLYDELIRMVLMLHVPGEPPGKTDSQVRMIDLMPTLVDLLKLKCTSKVRRQMQGRSLVGLMRGKKELLDAYSETDCLWQVSKRSIRSWDGWKLIFDLTTGSKELYDLKTDPLEKTDLFTEKPKVAFDLEEKLSRYTGH